MPKIIAQLEGKLEIKGYKRGGKRISSSKQNLVRPNTMQEKPLIQLSGKIPHLLYS